jgi:Tol biopolymer transport system component
VKQVVVGVRSGSDTAWTFANLTQSANPTRWTGGVSISGSQFEYFVQAVDENGNVGVSTNKGFYYDGATTPPAPTGDITATLTGGAPTNGWFTATPGLNVTAPAGVTTQVSIDGGAFKSPPDPITGDGLHTVDVRASNGGTARLFAPVDTTAPEIIINTPAAGGTYLPGSIVKADFLCRDSGSGLTTPCHGTVANGANIDTTPGAPRNFTVDAVTDAVGHTFGPVTVTYNVGTRKILFTSARTGDGDIYVMNPDGTNPTVINPSPKPEEQPAWSPDGSKIAFASKRNDKDGSGLDIFVMDANGQHLKQLTTAKGDDTAPSWSPTGQQIAFQSKRDMGPPPEIWIMNADGTRQTRLTNSSKQDIEPVWSPDGSKIAFMSDRMGGPNIWVMKPDGTGVTQLTFTKAPEGDPAWSPDGTLIAYGSKKFDKDGSAFDVLTMKPDGTFVQRLTTVKGDDLEPTWSRDGLKLAFTSNRDGNAEVYTMNANGTDQQRRTNKSGADRQPDW